MKVCSIVAGGSEGGSFKTCFFLQDGKWAVAFQITARTHSSKSPVAPKAGDKKRGEMPQKAAICLFMKHLSEGEIAPPSQS